jgi:O-antigen biosynthesis protein
MFNRLHRRTEQFHRGTLALVGTLGAFIARKNRLRLALAAWRVVRTQGLRGLKQELLQFFDSNVSYRRWVARHDTLRDDDCAAIRMHVLAMTSRPLISVLVPTYNTQERWLRRAIESVREQLYPHWELCIADDASTASGVRRVMEEYSRLDPRIRVVFRDVNGHICAASNSALEIATGDFIALLDHDDELPRHALYMVAAALNDKPRLDLIYSDEDKIDEAGRRFAPYFKPDWNPALLTAQNVVSHLGVYRTSLVRSLGGFREGYEGSQDWDLALRVSEVIASSHIRHIPHILYHWRATVGSTSVSTEGKPYALQSAAKALRNHLERTGCEGSISDTASGYFRIRPKTPEPPPWVSIVILARSGVTRLRRCIASLREGTRYPNIELLVVNNSDDTDMQLYLGQIAAEGVAQVLKADRDLNVAARINFAVKIARGGYVCLMDSGIEAISADWLEEMVAHAARRGTGAVGAKLYDPDDNIQHAGLILGMGHVCGPIYSGMPRSSGGYMKRLLLLQNMSAVTSACMLVRKEVYEEIGGLDEDHLTHAYSTVDFCLRLLEHGYRNLWTPYAELYSDRLPERGLDGAAYMRARWDHMLRCDPAHNPNLTLKSGWPGLAPAPRVNKPWASLIDPASQSEAKP